MKRPQQKQEFGRCRLEQGREVNVEGAKADAVFPQLGAGRLIERLQFFGDGIAAQHAEIFREPKGKPPGQAGKVRRLA